ncbi:MAG TPA: hypothetical protein VGG54_25335 [Trebonia sp.]|jgi:anti-sigma factor RsiW
MTLTQAPRQVSSQAVTGQPPPSRRRGAAAPRRTAFWPLAVVPAVTMLGTTLPTAVLIFSVLLAALGLFSASHFARGAR